MVTGSGVSRKSVRGAVTLRFTPTSRRDVVRIAYLDGGALRALRPSGDAFDPNPPPLLNTPPVTATREETVDGAGNLRDPLETMKVCCQYDTLPLLAPRGNRASG